MAVVPHSRAPFTEVDACPMGNGVDSAGDAWPGWIHGRRTSLGGAARGVRSQFYFRRKSHW